MFEPWNGSNAVQECVFAITVNGIFDSNFISKVEEMSRVWSDVVPAPEKPQIIQLTVGQPFPVQPPSVSGAISYSSFKKDGTVEWRLSFDHNTIAINCLSYDGWKNVLPVVKRLIGYSIELISSKKMSISNIAMQYINGFKWIGDQKGYSIDKLFRMQDTYIPRSIWEGVSGPLWHVHQGYYSPFGDGVAGRVLKRVHLDAVVEAGVPVVRMDAMLRVDPFQSIHSTAPIMVGQDGRLWVVFESLHALHKRTVADYLSDEMCARINVES